MTQVTIDGKTIEVPGGTTVLQASREAGVEIPTLCDHPAVKPYGGCRLCVVEIQGARVLQASCTLPVSNGMVVFTDTPKVRQARKFVLDLIFSERNHFCMYCQKTDGDCELQNAAYGEEMNHWALQPNWKPFPVDGSGPYFVIDHNRCILCRRCVRACAELVGNFTLGIENRGASSMLMADSGLPIGESSCVRCGTCVQVCPTGAIIDRGGAYLGKECEATHVQSVCVGCSVGCGIDMVVRDNQLFRVNGDWAAPVNGGVLCVTGRFESLEDGRQRLTTPLLRRDGALVPATWDEALDSLASRLGPLASQSEPGVAALVSTRLPAEALYAFKKLFNGRLHSGMVTSIEEDLTTAQDPTFKLGHSLEALKASDCVMLVGADLGTSHQVAGFMVKRNLPAGARLIVVDPFENELNAVASYAVQVQPGTDASFLQGLMASLIQLGLNRTPAPAGLPPLQESSLACGVPAQMLSAIAGELSAAKAPVFVFGKGLRGGQRAQVLEALQALAQMVGEVAFLNPKGKANSLAAAAYGLDKTFEPQGYQAVFLALGDDMPTPRLVERVAGAPFLAVQASYASPLTEQADVVLPVEGWAEQEGHYLNLEGRLQAAHRGVRAPAGVRSNLEVLESLAHCLGAETRGDWKAEIVELVPAAA